MASPKETCYTKFGNLKQ